MSQLLTERLSQLQAATWKTTIQGIRRGIERETLRVNPNGTLAQTDHPKALGSALTHPLITTDFSESLLEFITPAQSDIATTIAQLEDIHRFAVRQIGEERLGAGSMPCYIAHQDEIRLAQYGTSNVGRMKTLYRQGLKNRYGSMMQAISGVHFNFSIPDAFWQHYQELVGDKSDQADFVSEQYLALIRNYKRYVWLIVYLFGASPSLCRSFLEGRTGKYPFQKLGEGSLYLPYATSLRMSDLGYTNSAQSALAVSYNSLVEYIQGLQDAISTPSSEYQSIGIKVGDEYQQLNANILQIENEFYSTIRPKRTIQSGERPTCALSKRGVEYIEVRALDVNPFSPVGIDESQMRFLDVFLLYCLLQESPSLSQEEQAVADSNLKKVVAEGRRQGLDLIDRGAPRLMQDWAEQLFAELLPIAHWLDESFGADNYATVVKQYYVSLLNPAQTLSGRILALQQQEGSADVLTKLSQGYKDYFLAGDFKIYQQADFEEMATTSLAEQKKIEAQDELSFDAYIEHYFTEKPCI